MESSSKQFLSKLKENEAIIHKVCRVYGSGKEDRQDLFQDITVQLWQSYPSYRGESKFSTWMYRVALNTAITKVKKQRLPAQTDRMDEAWDEVDLSSDPQLGMEEREQVNLLYKAIAFLNKVERALVILYLEDYSYSEMEEIMGIRQGALRVKMTRIKEKLKRIAK